LSILEVKDLSFGYKNGLQVIKRINFTVNKYDCIAIKGPNGSGKTTLAKLLTKIIRPTGGHILLEGKEISDLTLADIGKKIGYVMQNPERQLFSTTVEEDIGFSLRYRGFDSGEIEKRIDEMLDFFELGNYRKTSPFILSRGEQQRLVIASVLALEPEILLLDEPTTGLDPLRKRKLELMLSSLYKRGTTLIVISHDHKFLSKLFNKELYIENGFAREDIL
jgi:energy-coupling factor transport system ATP-binding protein